MKSIVYEQAGIPLARVFIGFSGLATTGLLLFVVPRHVPLRGLLDSQSYVFGLALTLVFLFWRHPNHRQLTEMSLAVISQVHPKITQGIRTRPRVALGCALAFCMLVLGWRRTIPYGVFGITAKILTYSYLIQAVNAPLLLDLLTLFSRFPAGPYG